MQYGINNIANNTAIIYAVFFFLFFFFCKTKLQGLPTFKEKWNWPPLTRSSKWHLKRLWSPREVKNWGQCLQSTTAPPFGFNSIWLPLKLHIILSPSQGPQVLPQLLYCLQSPSSYDLHEWGLHKALQIHHISIQKLMNQKDTIFVLYHSHPAYNSEDRKTALNSTLIQTGKNERQVQLHGH